MPQKNLAFETLKKLLSDQIRFQRKKNLVQARSFEELLEKSIRAYMNRSIDTAQVVQQLADLAKTVKAVNGRGIRLGSQRKKSPSTMHWRTTRALSSCLATKS